MKVGNSLLFLAFAAAAVIVLAPQAALAKDCGDGIATCACGDTVVADYTFTSNLYCEYGEDGLIVGADDITIDMNGENLEGEDSLGTVGINIAGHSNVTITSSWYWFKGLVRDFNIGINMGGDKTT